MVQKGVAASRAKDEVWPLLSHGEDELAKERIGPGEPGSRECAGIILDIGGTRTGGQIGYATPHDAL